MRTLWQIAAFLLAGVLEASAGDNVPFTPPNVSGFNGSDTVTWSTTGSLSYATFPVIIGANGFVFATITGQLECDSGGDATIKIIAGTGANPASGATIEGTIVSGSMYAWAFAGGQGNGTRYLIKPNQELMDSLSGTQVHKSVFINTETFTGGRTVMFLDPNSTDPPVNGAPVPTLGDVINIVFNNPGLTGNPVTVSYTVTASDVAAGNYVPLTINLTSAINANTALQAAKIAAWSSPTPYTIQIAQLSGTPASTTISYTKGTNTETIWFGLFAPGAPSPGSLDTSAGGTGIYSLTGTQPDVNPAYPYTQFFTVVPVPGSGIISLSPEMTFTNCNPFNVSTYSGILTGLTPGTTYWLNVSVRSISGSSISYTNNYFNYVTY